MAEAEWILSEPVSRDNTGAEWILGEPVVGQEPAGADIVILRRRREQE